METVRTGEPPVGGTVISRQGRAEVKMNATSKPDIG
jgi:hypothetical protein